MIHRVLATVVLGDHDNRARAAVRVALEHHGFSVVAEADDADEAVEAARRYRPSLCLLDVDLPGGGIDAADRINSELPDTKLAVLSGSAQRDLVREAIRAGADGYLLRSTAPDRLCAALAGVIKGEAALPRSLTGSLVRDLREIERRLEQSSNGHAPPPLAAAQAARARRTAAARGAAAAHRAAEARRAGEVRRAAEARRAEQARRAEATARAAGRLPLSRAISSRVLYAPRLARHFRRRLHSGMSVTIAWNSARARMIDYM
ncbi:MAG TPA: response regulator transcription factor [Solirubrobacteraceae bacterium]|nr:response regulator transcription factor [Solirubrobacteraceae bacterium]